MQAQLASRRGSHVANSTAGPIKVTAAASAAQAELPNLSDHGSTTESDTEETAPVEAEVVTEDTRPEPKTAGALCLPSSEAEAAKGGRPGSSSLSAASLQAPHSAAECLPGSDLPAASSATAIDCGPGSQLQTVGVITRDAAGEPKAACIDGVAGCKAGHAVQTQHAVRGKDCQPGISGGDRVTGGKGLQTGLHESTLCLYLQHHASMQCHKVDVLYPAFLHQEAYHAGFMPLHCVSAQSCSEFWVQQCHCARNTRCTIGRPLCVFLQLCCVHCVFINCERVDVCLCRSQLPTEACYAKHWQRPRITHQGWRNIGVCGPSAQISKKCLTCTTTACDKAFDVLSSLYGQHLPYTVMITCGNWLTGLLIDHA